MIIYNSNPDLFKPFKIEMLVDIKGSGVSKGGFAVGFLKPNKSIDLEKFGITFKTNAKEGVHFKRI